uniref:hypothetical protein n=1 Tax=Burkholderia sp. M701 TaxID=326454 RepID=UPI00159EDFDC|nr:hypothetical protein [Burkholderia sp. M701]
MSLRMTRHDDMLAAIAIRKVMLSRDIVRLARLARDNAEGLARSAVFPADEPPVQVGFYEVENLYFGAGWSIAYWDGCDWCSTGTGLVLRGQRRQWRGLRDRPMELQSDPEGEK